MVSSDHTTVLYEKKNDLCSRTNKCPDQLHIFRLCYFKRHSIFCYPRFGCGHPKIRTKCPWSRDMPLKDADYIDQDQTALLGAV